MGSLSHLTLWLTSSVPSGFPQLPLFCRFLVQGRFAFRMPAVSPEFPGENSIYRNSPLGACLCCPRFRSDAFYSPTPRARGATGSQSEQQASGSPLSSAPVSLKEAECQDPLCSLCHAGDPTTYSCVTLGWSCHFSVPCTVQSVKWDGVYCIIGRSR